MTSPPKRAAKGRKHEPWTHFHDMHSGGGQKLDWGNIFIEGDEATARGIFTKRFGRDPDNVTCYCCGPDYSVTESRSLRLATAFSRGCRYLRTPRDATGRYVEPTDPAFRDHYYLEDGEEPPAGFQVDDSPRWNGYQTLGAYVKTSGVLVVRARKQKLRAASKPKRRTR
jgi:hypothetical protein